MRRLNRMLGIVFLDLDCALAPRRMSPLHSRLFKPPRKVPLLPSSQRISQRPRSLRRSITVESFLTFMTKIGCQRDRLVGQAAQAESRFSIDARREAEPV